MTPFVVCTVSLKSQRTFYLLFPFLPTSLSLSLSLVSLWPRENFSTCTARLSSFSVVFATHVYANTLIFMVFHRSGNTPEFKIQIWMFRGNRKGVTRFGSWARSCGLSPFSLRKSHEFCEHRREKRKGQARVGSSSYSSVRVCIE